MRLEALRKERSTLRLVKGSGSPSGQSAAATINSPPRRQRRRGAGFRNEGQERPCAIRKRGRCVPRAHGRCGRDRRPRGRVFDVALLGECHCRPLGRFGGFREAAGAPPSPPDRPERPASAETRPPVARWSPRRRGKRLALAKARASSIVSERDSGNEGVTVPVAWSQVILVKVIGRSARSSRSAISLSGSSTPSNAT